VGIQKLVVNQIREKYAFYDPHLKQYYQEAKELEELWPFNIQSLPMDENHITNTLALVGSCFTSYFNRSIYHIKVKILHKPLLLDNVDAWQVFNSNKQICRFLQNKGKFEGLHVNHQVKEENVDIIQLKTNKIPPRLFVLESMFDSNYASTSTSNINNEIIRKVQKNTHINLGI
jgi:hypothetical protein